MNTDSKNNTSPDKYKTDKPALKETQNDSVRSKIRRMKELAEKIFIHIIIGIIVIYLVMNPHIIRRLGGGARFLAVAIGEILMRYR
jgi:hypothetical protein